MMYRGVFYEIIQDIDVHICWRWSFAMNGREQSGQTKISFRAAEIQAQSAIDGALESNVWIVQRCGRKCDIGDGCDDMN